MASLLDRYFRLQENGTTVRRELLAGLVTFLTMAYIIFVHPAILSKDFSGNPTGLDFGAVLLATCLASGLASLFMGIYANYPIALAPGMGENVFFVSAVVSLTALGVPEAWRVALGIVFFSGLLFIGLSLFGAREAIINSLTPSLRSGIAVGIGLFIALIGFRNGGLIVVKSGTGIGLNPEFLSPEMGIFLFGLSVTAVLQVRRVPGSIFWGILAGTAFASLLGEIRWEGRLFGLPEIGEGAFLKLDLVRSFSLTALPWIIVFLFMDLFDCTGTLIAVAEQAGLIQGNQIPRAKRALFVDAVAATGGACLGTSTVLSFIESAAGVQMGGRTGLVSVATGLLFLLAIFLSPVIALLGQHPPLTAPALVIVGALMAENVKKIDWRDTSESFPAFLTMVGIPLTYSIADGLALGLASYPVVKLLSGRGREVRCSLYLVFLFLVAYFVWIRPKI
jgi:AGZA family xanthine/uracil permease-like MFS transporter